MSHALYLKLKEDLFEGTSALSEAELRSLVKNIFANESQPEASMSLFLALGDVDHGDDFQRRGAQCNAIADAVTEFWEPLSGDTGYQAASHVAALAASILNNPAIHSRIRHAFRDKIENEIIVATESDITNELKTTPANRLMYLFRTAEGEVSAFWGNESIEKNMARAGAHAEKAVMGALTTFARLADYAARKEWKVGPLRGRIEEFKKGFGGVAPSG